MRRRGMTLMEVLIAIFVMAIGLLAVMSLFPFGAARMAVAIKSDRAGHAAANARALATALNVRFDPAVTRNFNLTLPADWPSNPVFADPVGYASYSANSGTKGFVAGNTSLPRSTLSVVTSPPPGLSPSQAALRWCTLLDDITFGTDGTPYLSNSFVDRAGSFTWAWMIQRPKSGNAACATMSVVVFNQRPISGVGRMSGKEVAYPKSYVDPSNIGGGEGPIKHTLVTLTWPQSGTPAPQISEGGWVLDATPDSKGVPTGTFHRVVSVGDVVPYQFNAALQSLPLELGRPLTVLPGTPPRNIIVMDSVSEVMDCGPAWKSGNN
jgi:prepilin-type N-terminal cleavage/methylation domain-containing protein